MKLEIAVKQGDMPAALRELARRMDPSERHEVMSLGVTGLVEEHFRRKGQTNHNRFGERSTFWGRMIAGTKAAHTASEAITRMPREIAQRFYGGRLTAKKADYLAIPARAEAYNKAPRSFNDLHLIVFGRTGTAALVKNRRSVLTWRKTGGYIQRRTEHREGSMVYFWLKKSVTQDADPSVLPTREQIIGVALHRLSKYLARRN